MAGTQIVLHRYDTANNQNKDETRNLGLQSIVARENEIVAELINDASRQGQVASQINQDIRRMNSIMSTLNWAANTIFNIIQDAYMADTTKTQKFVDIQKGALEQAK
jgi:hypothetical protein